MQHIRLLFILIIFLALAQKTFAQISCPGFTSTTKSPDGKYKVTAFGCSIGWKDPNDNCIPTDPPTECTSQGKTGADCEELLDYYAANVDVFGAGQKLLVTRPDTGKSVVVITIDTGPHCSREQQYGPLLDLSYAAATSLGPGGGNYETVTVKEVASNTKLGPTDGSGITVEEGNDDSSSSTDKNPSGKTSAYGNNCVAGVGAYDKNQSTLDKIKLLLGIETPGCDDSNNSGADDKNTSGNNGPVNPDASCPGQGPITCGTIFAGCHCSASYNSSVCGGTCSWCVPPDDSSKYAIDISNPLDGSVYIPKISINGQAHTVSCIGVGNFSGSTEPNQVIEVLSCSDDVTDQAIWMQFHHSKKSNPLNVGASYKSGDAVGRSASFQVLNSGPHVHFQMGVGGPCGYQGTNGCVVPNEYVRC